VARLLPDVLRLHRGGVRRREVTVGTADDVFDLVEDVVNGVTRVLAGSFCNLADHATWNCCDFLQDPHAVVICSPHAALRHSADFRSRDLGRDRPQQLAEPRLRRVVVVALVPRERHVKPGDIAHDVGIARQIADAVREAKLPHVVLLSSAGAQHPDGTGPIKALHHAEKLLAATGAAITAVRAAYFQEDWASSLGALAQNILPTFVPKTVRYAQVATPDIGRTVAAALVEGGRGVRHIELAGPHDYTAEDVAAALTKQHGRAIAAVDVPLDQAVPTLTSVGVPAPSAALFAEMYAGIISGRVAFEGTPRRGTVEVGTTLAGLR
jgi:uncharacterized protein YbjT (DUF2867 family)